MHVNHCLARVWTWELPGQVVMVMAAADGSDGRWTAAERTPTETNEDGKAFDQSV